MVRGVGDIGDDYVKYLKQANAEWLEETMAAYGQDVWNFAFLITKNRAMADDVAQETFLRAYRQVHEFRGESSVKTWLLKITRNISLNHRNAAFIRKVLLVDLIARKGSERSAEQTFMEREVVNAVWVCLFKLPDKHREALLLHVKHQMPLHEIAHVLGIPEGTVKSRLFSARKKLSKMLKEESVYEPV